MIHTAATMPEYIESAVPRQLMQCVPISSRDNGDDANSRSRNRGSHGRGGQAGHGEEVGSTSHVAFAEV